MSTAKKLLIKPGYRMTILNMPDTYAFPMDEFPEGVEVTETLDGEFEWVLLFAHNQEELNKYAPEVFPWLKGDAPFWVAYPKKSSKIKTDISRDQGWEMLQEAGYQGVSLVSLNDIWSAFRVRDEKYIKPKK
ncbi:MAG: hypothetical protein WCC10_03320 [Tumebacillaceae bacterium]